MAVINPEKLFDHLEKTMKKSKAKSFKRWQKQAKKVIKKEMLANIKKGKSPVSGQGSYKDYSESYKKQIRGKLGKQYNKKVKPVNLKLSGKMLKSLKVKNIRKGISVYFSSKIAKYHNGQGRVNRYMIPTESGQEFRRDIKIKLARIYKKVFKI